MKEATRRLALVGACIVAIALVGCVYSLLIKPQQAVWNEDNPVHWKKEQFPLTVHSSEYPEALKTVVGLWNSQARFDLFRVAPFAGAVIDIEQGAIEVGEESVDWAASAFVLNDTKGNPVRARIVVHIPLISGTDAQVLHHELGHVLGLAHDKSHTMRPLTKESLTGPLEMIRAQDKDIEALRKRYR